MREEVGFFFSWLFFDKPNCLESTGYERFEMILFTQILIGGFNYFKNLKCVVEI